MIRLSNLPAFAVLCLSTLFAFGLHNSAQSQPTLLDPWAACSQAAATAEQNGGLPSGLLLAIGKVESGRIHSGTGRIVPWPFALNIAGRAVYPHSAEAAIVEVRAAQAEGTKSIDVGCFQINLQHHPRAFAVLEDAFDPTHNAAYAARFLQTLRARLASWELATGGYHSMTPMFAEPYAARVAAARSSAETAHPADVKLASFPAAVLPSIRVFAPGTTVADVWSGTASRANPRMPIVYSPTSQ